MLVSSRIFGIEIGGVKTDALVPYADMLNHQRPRTTAWYYSDERGAFVIDAIDDIARGSQVYDSYGKKCNSRFFLNYGFINQNNDADETPLIARLDEADAGYEYKVKQIGLKNTSQKFRVVANLEEKVMTNFLAYCRYVSFDGDLTKLELERQDKIAAAI